MFTVLQKLLSHGRIAGNQVPRCAAAASGMLGCYPPNAVAKKTCETKNAKHPVYEGEHDSKQEQCEFGNDRTGVFLDRFAY